MLSCRFPLTFHLKCCSFCTKGRVVTNQKIFYFLFSLFFRDCDQIRLTSCLLRLPSQTRSTRPPLKTKSSLTTNVKNPFFMPCRTFSCNLLLHPVCKLYCILTLGQLEHVQLLEEMFSNPRPGNNDQVDNKCLSKKIKPLHDICKGASSPCGSS